MDKANNIYDKYTEDVFGINHESEHTEENIDLEDVYNEIYECYPNDFSFDNFDLEDEGLERLIKYFDSEAWSNLDVDDKRAVIQSFETYLVKTLDLKRPPRVIFYYGPQGDCGAFNRANNTIKINMNMIDDPQMAISTIAHETWHAYQYQCAENPQNRKDALYAINFINYVTPVMVDGNWIQTKEYVSENAVSVENYTAKQISELSEFMDGEGAFSMLIQLRENPEKAHKKIEKGFVMR